MRVKACPTCGHSLDLLGIACIDCGRPFDLTSAELEFFRQHDLQIPRRCRSCRAVKKAADLAREPQTPRLGRVGGGHRPKDGQPEEPFRKVVQGEQ